MLMIAASSSLVTQMLSMKSWNARSSTGRLGVLRAALIRRPKNRRQSPGGKYPEALRWSLFEKYRVCGCVRVLVRVSLGAIRRGRVRGRGLNCPARNQT